MRRPVLLVVLAAACAGSEPAAPADVPASAGCEGFPAVATELHLLGEVGADLPLALGPCGHLVARDQGRLLLAAPDLASLDEVPGSLGDEVRFAPTGEALEVRTAPAPKTGLRNLAWIDLRTGRQVAMQEALDSWFVPRRDGSGSLHLACSEAGVSVFDGAETRLVAEPPVGCDRLVVAAEAPVIAYPGPFDRLRITDLETGATVEANLKVPPLDHDQSGVPYRDDVVHLSADGDTLVHQAVEVRYEYDQVHRIPEPKVSVVDVRSGRIVAEPEAAGGGPEAAPVVAMDLPGRRLLWITGGRISILDASRTLRSVEPEVESVGPIGRNELYAELADEDGFVRVDPATGDFERLDPALGRPLLSPDGRSRAAAYCDDAAPRSRIEGAGAEPRDVPGRVLWLADDGTALTEDGATLRLFASDGVERLSIPAPTPERLRAGAGWLVALSDRTLHAIEPASGHHRLLGYEVEGFAVDPSVRRVAFVTDPDGAASRYPPQLWAGRLAPRD